MAESTFNLRKFTAAHWLLFAVVAISGTVDMFRMVSVGGISGLGLWTLLVVAFALGLWLLKPYLPRRLMLATLPLLMFEMYATGSLMWYSLASNALQLLAVGLAFLALILLTARETSRDFAMAEQLQTGLLWSSAFAVAVYCLAIVRGDADDTARAFALYAMIPVAISVSRWRAGNFRQLLWAAVVLLAIFASLSRTALVCALFLFPLAVALRGTKKSIISAVVMLATATAGFFVLIFTYQPLYERFFAYDASIKVGDVSVNSSGRSKMWNMLLDTLGDDWVFGKGISSSETLIAAHFNVGHPHNDFLRFYYDLGAVGLSLWICFIVGFVITTMKNLRRSIQNNTDDYPLHLAALLSLTAVTGSMFTDNSITYSFVMMPLGILLGCSLGAARLARSGAMLSDPPPLLARGYLLSPGNQSFMPQ